MKKKVVMVVALSCAALVIGATLALGVGGGAGERSAAQMLPKRRVGSPAAQGIDALTGQASGGGCRVGVDTDQEGGIPTGDEGFYNVASAVQISKPCPGIVVGQLVTETGLDAKATGSGFLAGVMLATCVSKGGYSSPCTPGTEVIAAPGEMFLDEDVQSEIETRSMNAVWPNLKRGVWLFEFLVRGDGTNAALFFRTFHVEAFSGGPAS